MVKHKIDGRQTNGKKMFPDKIYKNQKSKKTETRSKSTKCQDSKGPFDVVARFVADVLQCVKGLLKCHASSGRRQ